MSKSRIMTVVVRSERASAVTQRSISMPSACSCFCAPQPPWAIFGGGLVQRRATPPSKEDCVSFISCRSLHLSWVSNPVPQKETVDRQNDADKQNPPDPPILKAPILLLLFRRKRKI